MDNPSARPSAPGVYHSQSVVARAGRHAARYVVAAIGISLIGLWLRSWLFAPLAVLALVQALRTALHAFRYKADERRFGTFGEEAYGLVEAGEYRRLLDEARRVVSEAQTEEIKAWALEWAAYGAIRSHDGAQMTDLLPQVLRSSVPPHVPAQLYAALGDHESAVPYFESSLLRADGHASAVGLVHALAASGESERAHRVIEQAHAETPTTATREWLVWSKLERDEVQAAYELVSEGSWPDLSPWGMSVFQVAAMRAGDQRGSLDWGARAIAAQVDRSIRPVVVYNRACSYAQLGDAEAAMGELRSVGDAQLVANAATDEDLEPLRALDEFQRIVSSAGGGSR